MVYDNNITILDSLKFLKEMRLPQQAKKQEIEAHVDNIISQISKEFFKTEDRIKKFKGLSDRVQTQIVEKKFILDYFPYLKGKAQQAAFETHQNEIVKYLFEFSDEGTSLTMRENSLSLKQISAALKGLSFDEKSKIVTLDLSALQEIDGLSCLEGFSSLETLKLPPERYMKNMEGIETVGQHLRSLDMDNTGVKTLDFLEHCKALIELNAGGCGQLADIWGLKKCSTLKSLVLPEEAPLLPHIRDEILNGLNLVPIFK